MNGSSEDDLIGTFGLAIDLFISQGGKMRTEFQSYSRNVPVEFIVMQLKAFTAALETGYNSKFGSTLTPAPGDE